MIYADIIIDISSDKLDRSFSISCTGKAGEENKGRDGWQPSLLEMPAGCVKDM